MNYESFELRKVYSSLKIKDFSLLIKLGVNLEERMVPQEILVSIEIRFKTPPKGTKTDQIDNTICYSDVCSIIENYLITREYNLIEKLGGDLFQLLREIIGRDNQIWIQVHKINPPIKGLRGGAIFCLGDFEKETYP